jgi:glyoxylase-like metal-dependent hydrolase (beta-lactamase superfamily II)
MSKAPIIPLAPNVYRIPTLGDFINSFAFVNDDESITLIDCGVKRAPAKIVRALDAIGKAPGDVTRIVLTHAHNDHAGGAAHMLQKSGVDGVVVHADDADFINTGVGAPRDDSVRFGSMFSRIPGGGFEPVPVNEYLHDGSIIDCAGGIRVLHTPGHTPGHISLLHEPTGVLITGDAIWNMRSRMTWPIAAFCTSASLNRQTAAVLGDVDYSIAAFTHGPHIGVNAREAVRGFLHHASQS